MQIENEGGSNHTNNNTKIALIMVRSCEQKQAGSNRNIIVQLISQEGFDVQSGIAIATKNIYQSITSLLIAQQSLGYLQVQDTER